MVSGLPCRKAHLATEQLVSENYDLITLDLNPEEQSKDFCGLIEIRK